MFNPRTIYKFLDLLTVFAVFFTPLLFFTQSRDQFELPKLTFLVLLAVPMIAVQLKEKVFPRWTPLSFALGAFFLTQTLSSLPGTSLSWKTSLLGDYENFSGLTTLTAYFLWFWALNRVLNEVKIGKIFYFNSLAAVLSSFYAIGQHFGFDFIQWNPESVNSTREFASLGNPNFLSAYLAMSIPLFSCLCAKVLVFETKKTEPPGPLFGFLGPLSLILLLLGTGKGLSLAHLSPSASLSFAARTSGFFLLSITCIRFSLFNSWWTFATGFALLSLGLFSTASRGGFLGAIVGMGIWLVLAIQKNELLASFRQNLAKISKLQAGMGFVVFSLIVILFSHSFLNRLAFSVIHMGQSLEVSRLHIWGPALQIIKANPLWGVGLDTFKIAFPYYSGIEFNLIDGMFMSSRMAHNELLQVAATTGLLGLAAYLSVLLAFGFMWWKTYRQAGPSTRWLLAALLASAIAYHVQNLFSFGVATINFLWFLYLAVVQNLYRKIDLSRFEPSKGIRLPSNAGKTLLAALLVLILLFFPPRLGADIAFARGNAVSELLKKPDPQMSTTELLYYSEYQVMQLRKAVNLCPLDVKYRLYLGLAYEQRAQLDSDRSKDWRLEALHCYQKAVEMSPANAYYYNDEGRIYNNLAGSDPQNLTKAEEAFGNSVKWAPASPFFILNWAMALEKTGQERKAREQIEKSFKLDRAFTSKVLAQMAFEAYKSGDKKSAFADLAEAINGNTASAEAYYCRGILYLSEKEKKKALADLEAAKNLNPTAEKNPSIRSLDQFIEQAKN